MVIMNHENGSLIALLGGRDYERKGSAGWIAAVNRARRSNRSYRMRLL
ncbi:hypothetical protein HMSSN139_42030 [Paenibacillus sp. HMSSN-139]|nr:hypothetical protein HMSSN139_42030 [Paenibacillus sp. HMSSN-139]